MPKITDEYAERAFQNISDAMSGESSDMDAFDVIAEYFGENIPAEIDTEDKSEYLDSTCDIRARRIRLEGEWYKNCVMPMIAVTDEGETAVIPDAFGRCRYYSGGKPIKITKKNAEAFGTDALCFYKGLGEGSVSEKGLLKYMFNAISVKDKLNVLAMSMLVTLTGMVFPLANYMIFDRIIPSGTLNDILPIAALFIGVIGATAIAQLLQANVLTNVISKLAIYVQSALFSRVMRLKAGFFKGSNAGELAEIITSFADIGSIVSAQSVTVGIGAVLSLAYLIQMHIYAPSLMGAVIGVTVVIIALNIREAWQYVNWKREYEASTAELAGFVYEFFSLMEKVMLNGAATRMFERWTEKYRAGVAKRDKPLQLKYSQVISKLVTLAALVLVFYIGANASMPIADYIAFNSAYGSYIAAISSIGIVLESVSALSSSIRLLKPMLDAETEETADKRQIKEIKGDIEFSNVSFRYAPDLPDVIDGLSLSIHAGESIGIVGSSGCGKSTLLRLLLGFEEPTAGGIFIDGTDIRELDKRSYRKKLGIVLQDSKLLNDDIYSNITLTAPNATVDDVWEAVENAGLLDDIEDMPMGLRTIVSEENSTISGGQKQRILIARAIVAKPPILIFDEATSALDNITQSKVIESVKKLNSTRIMIAHRLSTIEDCDRILVLDKGKIAQSGTFAELAAQDGLFKKMLLRQTI